MEELKQLVRDNQIIQKGNMHVTAINFMHCSQNRRVKILIVVTFLKEPK